MNRRDFIACVAALIAARQSLAQQSPKVWRVAVLTQSFSRTVPGRQKALLQGLRELGYLEGKNLALDWRNAQAATAETVRQLAIELVQSKPDVIVTTSTTATTELQKLTTTIPIVMTTIGDPIGSGFIKSFARPGGNITGMTNSVVEISPKHLEMLLAVVPRLSRVAVLFNPDNVSNVDTARILEDPARKSGVKLLPLQARTPQDLPNAFAVAARDQSQALILAQDSLFVQQRQVVAELARKARLPAVAPAPDFAEAGLLMSYGPDFNDIYRRAATHVAKILKGANPADLPVERPTKFEFVVNVKTAKALGITIPQSVLLQASRVIE